MRTRTITTDKAGAAEPATIRRGMSRREFLRSLAALGIGAAGGLEIGGNAALAHTGDPNHGGHPDAITHHAYDAVKGWTDWLKANGVRGYFGETSVPNSIAGRSVEDVQKWLGLLDKVYSWLDDADVWASGWVATRSGGSNHLKHYGPAPYPAGASYSERTIGEAFEQASVLEAHLTPPEGSGKTFRRGVNANGGELGVRHRRFSNENPGTFGVHYYYPDASDFTYLATRLRADGAAPKRIIRLPFRWERVQPAIGGSLSATEIQRLKDSVAAANAHNFQAILDVHNYAGYFLQTPEGRIYIKIGSLQLPVSAFADLWRRLSLEFQSHTQIVGYDIMNEPKFMPSTSTKPGEKLWEEASQAAVDAIRANGDVTRIFVPGYHKHPSVGKGGVFAFTLNHPVAWIRDPLDRTFYTTHGYWGRYRYAYCYDDDVVFWALRGY